VITAVDGEEKEEKEVLKDQQALSAREERSKQKSEAKSLNLLYISTGRDTVW
jgi:hypothetical protein